MAMVVVRGSMWANNSSTQRSAFCRHIPQRHHDAFVPRPFTSAAAAAPMSVSVSASASASASEKIRSPGFKRPEVIEWQENMPINNAAFIGTVVRDIQIQYLDSGKIVANSSMKVKRVMQNHSWFYLEFWGDLAEVAAAHLKIDDQIFVSGSVWPENVKGRDGLQKTFIKVVVKDLKFVLQDHNPECPTSVHDLKLKKDELWNDLFNNRADWTDTRGRKKTERHPDFKHTLTGRALWLNNKHTPDWVKERLMKEGGP